jgi:hypothetical protein
MPETTVRRERQRCVQDAESVKDILIGWETEPDYQELCFKLSLWAALEREGFCKIRLDCLSYERVHGVWRFAFTFCHGERSRSAVETRIHNACAQVGYNVNKNLVAARIQGDRAIGAFILKRRVKCQSPEIQR